MQMKELLHFDRKGKYSTYKITCISFFSLMLFLYNF